MLYCTQDCLFFFFSLFNRLDRQLQDIVYKLVVNLEESKSFSLLYQFRDDWTENSNSMPHFYS